MKRILGKIRLKILLVSARLSGFVVVGSHHIYPRHLSDNSVIVDVGGNKGDFYRELSSAFNCLYYFIEVDPHLVGALPSHPRLVAANVAISGVNGEAAFFLSNNSEANSFNEHIAKKYGVKEVIKVTCLTLESFCNEFQIEKINLLKIDVEGAEIGIFESMADRFLERIDQITIEFHEVYDHSLMQPTISCIGRLKKTGFIPVIFGSESFEDVVFLNRKTIKFTARQRMWLNVHNFFQYKGDH